MIAPSPLSIIEQALRWHGEGQPVALVTLVSIEGNASRSPGAQMAVAADGRAIGSFSGGCIEQAIVSEAVATISEGRGRTTRYGAGSPYIDLHLPCGGGIDLCFTPAPDPAILEQLASDLRARKVASFAIPECGFTVDYAPPLRIIAYGQGEELLGFARLASGFGALVVCCTPDAVAADQLACEAMPVEKLVSRSQPAQTRGDDWTAHVCFFHDHDWEEGLLPAALAQSGFYHGAIGSARTHQRRLAMLRDHGVSKDRIARMRGQIGLIASTRDPALLALSVLSEVASAYRDFVDRQRD